MESCHFQYVPMKDPPQLFQGDLLERTGEFADVLKNFYPYAQDNPEKYPYFVVLTQSCDLIAYAKQDRKAEHITVAAARPISFFLENEVSKIQWPVLKTLGVCLTKHKPSLLNRVNRLLSNEEYPFYYFHPSEQTPFSEALVVYLRVTFPLRTDLHYDACLEAKRVQLAPEFQAKLGWLTTLVFGRVATMDFDPNKRNEYANEYINSIEGLEWRKAGALSHEAKQKGYNSVLKTLPTEQLKELIASVDEKSRPEVMAELIIGHARTIWPDDENQLLRLQRRLLKDRDFKANLDD